MLERRPPLARDDVADVGRDRRAIGQVGPDEDHPRVGLGRSKAERDVGPVRNPTPRTSTSRAIVR